MREKPGAYRLHRDRLAAELAALDQNRPDRRVGPAVLRRIGRADDGSVVENDSPGPLDLQEERVDRIIDEEDRRGPTRPGALDLPLTPPRKPLSRKLDLPRKNG